MSSVSSLSSAPGSPRFSAHTLKRNSIYFASAFDGFAQLDPDDLSVWPESYGLGDPSHTV